MVDFTPPPVQVAKAGAKLLLVGLVALVVIVGLVTVIGFVSDPFGWRKARVERLTAQVVTQKAQADLDSGTGKIADVYNTTARIIIQQQEAKANEVQAIPSDDVPADVLSGWRSGLQHDNPSSEHQRPGEP